VGEANSGNEHALGQGDDFKKNTDHLQTGGNLGKRADEYSKPKSCGQSEWLSTLVTYYPLLGTYIHIAKGEIGRNPLMYENKKKKENSYRGRSVME